MEQRFGSDFSRVRVHTDTEAAESAGRLGARAYTVGQDVVFAAGRYAPDRLDGRRLLAHELAHVVQAEPRRGSGATDVEADAAHAVDTLLETTGPVRPAAAATPGAVLRQEAAEREPEPAAESAPTAAPLPALFGRPRLLDQELQRPEILADQPPVGEPLRLERLVETEVELAVYWLLRALEPIRGTPEAATVWPYVVEQVRRPKAVAPRGAPAELYDPSLVKVLGWLTPSTGDAAEDKKVGNRRKAEVLERVLLIMLAARDQRLGSKAEDADEAKREWDVLNDAAKRQFEQKLNTYRDVRAGLLAAFGALDVGTALALTRINGFYQTKIKQARFLGRETPVHEEMRERLMLAEGKLDAVERAAISRTMKSLSGTNIRPNANNPLALSEHSFGAAIDIDPTLNPNVPQFPARFIEEVTGVNLMVTAEGRRKADVFDLGEVFETLIFGRKDPALRELERLLAASQQLVGIFQDDVNLAAGMWAVAARMAQVPSGRRPLDLLATVRAARAEGPTVAWTYQNPKARIRGSAPRGVKHNELVAMLFPPGKGVWLPESPQAAQHKRHTVELLIQMADVYERSFAKEKRGRPKVKAGRPGRVKAEARAPAGEAALPQLVAHGFLNLSSALVSALRAPDGGDLRWLGASEHTKDFMHFELKKRPPRW
jgi:Domain of unknown function (DUF4157)